MKHQSLIFFIAQILNFLMFWKNKDKLEKIFALLVL